ncbi:MAG: anthranilate synthase component I family protein, partial [Candidatus Omnitrophica bacterium]|nr:anthranilate synthase component I family protein [Candidatus Omnitrophota bacterium]
SASLPYISPAVLYRRLTARNGSEGSILLESSMAQAATSRYSFILIKPYAVFTSKNRKCSMHRGNTRKIYSEDPLGCLDRLVKREASVRYAGLPPFAGGPAGFLSYELKDVIEKRRFRTADPFNLPDMYLGFYDKVIAIDHRLRKTKVIISTTFHNSRPLEQAYKQTKAVLRLYSSEVAGAIRGGGRDDRKEFSLGSEKRVTGKNDFMKMVRKAKRYIRQGDIFQANLSHCLTFSFSGDPYQVYLRQRKLNPTSFAAYADFGVYQIISASPERLLQSDGKRVSTRPIAGTRPRSDNAKKDRRLASELSLSEKERAEHVMLLDLERNDLGRVCEYGSVKVDELMTIERYSHVQHIVSNVSGRLKKNITAVDLIRAVVPGGTITGAPKVSAMQIIDRLEGRNRGIYTGSIGYISYCGRCEWNIVIRTMLIQKNKGYLQVGAGIVSDSDASKEYDETIHKAVSFLKMLRS